MDDSAIGVGFNLEMQKSLPADDQRPAGMLIKLEGFWLVLIFEVPIVG
ncbi:hypothetical protein [Lacticaseibacillus yichunensis]|uniref:Uncharacterized protein n=1 Tax=Lacticaseibacillus yichunensis TaxID=2486015 RepID=A0ABW4CQN6_9LACO|nr:hypothetical protein [Lacticaseibacillus yichunensis]